MSLFDNAKEFFGFAPTPMDDDAYYDEPRYANDGSAAYAPEREYSYGRSDEFSRAAAPAATVAHDYEPAIVTVAPRSYDDAKEIGEPFRDGDAVIMDLTDLERKSQVRMIDFAAGLCFALRGQMQNLAKYSDTERVMFAIVPEKARVTSSELERAAGLR